MVTLKNERVTLEIEKRGAQICKMTVNGKDVLWSGDPAWWAGIAPVLFPICGGVRDDTYTFDGNTYAMPKHGYARFRDFTVERQNEQTVTFLHTSDAETKAMYPFDYELRITYTLQDAGVAITYDVTNTSDGEMLFSIGSHEGYACPAGIENYDIVFETPQTLRSHFVEGSLLSRKTVTVLENGTVLPLKESYFTVDALVFKNIGFDSCVLRNRQDGKEIHVSFPDCKYLLLWQKQGAPYICIEPWCGIPSFVDEKQDLRVKEGLIALPAGETATRTHTISVKG